MTSSTRYPPHAGMQETVVVVVIVVGGGVVVVVVVGSENSGIQRQIYRDKEKKMMNMKKYVRL